MPFFFLRVQKMFTVQALIDSQTSESLRNKIMGEFNEMQDMLQQDMAHKRDLHKQEIE